MTQQQKVYILGHKNPDTDSICSAIAYADIRNRVSKGERYIPRRVGQINEETEYVLKRFGFVQPGYMPNVGTQVKDMDIFATPHLEATMSLKRAWDLMKENNITTVAVDNISELERCILSDLGSQGKNRGVPAMADYQYMQINLVNSLRYMKSWGINVLWTAWESVEQFTHPDGSQYSRIIPKISAKIVDNICGLCDVVGWIGVNKDREHMILLEPTQNIYAKNQIDSRKDCKVEDFINFTNKKEGK